MVKNINTAEYWDRTYAMEVGENRWRQHPEPWKAVYELLALLIDDNELVFADIGCGTGEFLFWLWPRFAPDDVVTLVGVDHSTFAIEHARKNAVESDYDGLTFWVGTAEKIPLPDASCDVVYSGHLIEHLDYPPDTFREQLRILKPGGRLIVHFPYEDAPYVEHVHILNEELVHRWVMAASWGPVFREGESPIIPGEPTNDKVIWYKKGEIK